MPTSLSLPRKEERLEAFPKNLAVSGVCYQTYGFLPWTQSGPKSLSVARWKFQSCPGFSTSGLQSVRGQAACDQAPDARVACCIELATSQVRNRTLKTTCTLCAQSTCPPSRLGKSAHHRTSANGDLGDYSSGQYVRLRLPRVWLSSMRPPAGRSLSGPSSLRRQA